MPIPAFGLIRGNLERTAILCFKVNIVGELTIEIPSRKEEWGELLLSHRWNNIWRVSDFNIYNTDGILECNTSE